MTRWDRLYCALLHRRITAMMEQHKTNDEIAEYISSLDWDWEGDRPSPQQIISEVQKGRMKQW